MNAIILAAGVGKRLWPVTQHRPKCLIEVGGRSLLVRYLEALAGVGVQQAVIVVGYKQDMIRDIAGTGLAGVSVRYLTSDQYQRGSITSLWRAREEMHGDVLIMDADVLFHRQILKQLIASASPTALLLDDTVKQQTEECMAIVRGGRVVALSKRMPIAMIWPVKASAFSKFEAPTPPRSLRRSKLISSGASSIWNMRMVSANSSKRSGLGTSRSAVCRGRKSTFKKT